MFKTMMEEACLPLMIADSKGRIIFANRWLKKSIGYTLTESLQDSLRDLCAPYEQNRYIFSCLPDIKRTTEVDIDLQQKNGEIFTANILHRQ